MFSNHKKFYRLEIVSLNESSRKRPTPIYRQLTNKSCKLRAHKHNALNNKCVQKPGVVPEMMRRSWRWGCRPAPRGARRGARCRWSLGWRRWITEWRSSLICLVLQKKDEAILSTLGLIRWIKPTTAPGFVCSTDMERPYNLTSRRARPEHERPVCFLICAANLLAEPRRCAG